MKYLRTFWNFIIAAWKLERGSGCLERFNLLTERATKDKTMEIPRDPGRVLLHEAETCYECGDTFLSLFPLKKCIDHEGFDKI